MAAIVDLMQNEMYQIYLHNLRTTRENSLVETAKKEL